LRVAPPLPRQDSRCAGRARQRSSTKACRKRSAWPLRLKNLIPATLENLLPAEGRAIHRVSGPPGNPWRWVVVTPRIGGRRGARRPSPSAPGADWTDRWVGRAWRPAAHRAWLGTTYGGWSHWWWGGAHVRQLKGGMGSAVGLGSKLVGVQRRMGRKSLMRRPPHRPPRRPEIRRTREGGGDQVITFSGGDKGGEGGGWRSGTFPSRLGRRPAQHCGVELCSPRVLRRRSKPPACRRKKTGVKTALGSAGRAGSQI